MLLDEPDGLPRHSDLLARQGSRCLEDEVAREADRSEPGEDSLEINRAGADRDVGACPVSVFEMHPADPGTEYGNRR